MAATTVTQEEQPISRTYQYRKVMKPMLERKRRARINRCLDELKELLVGALQAEGESVSRLEKADVLELTVRHLHKLRRSQQLSESSAGEKFRQGFVHCANEVSKYITSAVTSASTSGALPTLDLSVSTRLVTHLDQCIRSIESHQQQQLTTAAQLVHLPPPQGSSPPGERYLLKSQVSPGHYPHPHGPPGPPPSVVATMSGHHHGNGASSSGSGSSSHGSGSSSGGGLNILTSYTPPSSPLSSSSSPSSSSGGGGGHHSNFHHPHHHQKIYYVPNSSSVGGSPAGSTGSLSPNPPLAHYNVYAASSSSSAAMRMGPQPLSLCLKSPNPDEPFDLSNGSVWRPW